VHGDEINGIEIVRRLIQLEPLELQKGTVILVPMVNVYGVLNKTRYMPDRRDLNRCFPGSFKGSATALLAHTFLTEIVSHCQYGIDLHSGAIHRSNLPQIRANLSDPETGELAEKFGVPVRINSKLRDGTLRHSALELGAKVLLYEAGEALRFDELSIRAGVRGIQNVLAHLGILESTALKSNSTSHVADKTSWVRAGASGIVTNKRNLGDFVAKGDLLATIGNSFGDVFDRVVAKRAGIIIGKQNIPLVQQGDAMFHVAYYDQQMGTDIIGSIHAMSESLI